MLLTETVFILTTATALLFTYRYFESERRNDLVVVSVALTAAMMVRPESALMFVVLVLPLVLTRRRLAVRERLVQLTIAAVIPAVCLAPWIAYNLSRFEEPVLLSSGLGQTLLAGNCDSTYSGEKLGFWDFSCLGDPVEIVGDRGDLSAMDAVYRERALEHISENREQLPKVVTARVMRLWGVFRPEQSVGLDGMVEGRAGGVPGDSLRIAREAMWAYFVLLPLSVLGAVLLRRRRVQILPLFAQALIVTVVAAMTFGLTRYRAGVEVSIVVLAAVGLSWIHTALTGSADAHTVTGPLGPAAEPDDTESPTLRGSER
jgi:4-amino-4-deoxy-L-arabinose transferase-like glycosyltransferase